MAVMNAPTVSESRRLVLEALKRNGWTSAEEVASLLNISVAGARQHLSALTDNGMVTAEEVPRGEGERGRPRLVYSLTPLTESLFPKAYDELANELLRHLEAEDETLIEKIFVRRRDSRIENAAARLASKTTLRSKVAEVARILDEDGYLAEWAAAGGGAFRIIEHNCAILAVAQRHPNACKSEIEFLQTILSEASVERVSHIVAGAHQCAYLITPKFRGSGI